MNAPMEFDEALAAQIERMYSGRDVLRRRAAVRDALGAAPGERVLDVGCGPGFYAAEILDEVGPEGSVTGIDGAPAMLALAQRRCADRRNVEFHEADATALPVPDGAFDAALSVQVMEYVEDVDAALGEIHRALRPGGRVLIWDVDWRTLSMRTDDPARHDRVLAAWDAHLVHPALPRTLAARLRTAGFEDVRAAPHAFSALALDPDTYGGALAGVIEQFVAARGDGDDAAAWADEQRGLDERGEFYFAIVQMCFTAVAI